jgi:hypothetical protein
VGDGRLDFGSGGSPLGQIIASGRPRLGRVRAAKISLFIQR